MTEEQIRQLAAECYAADSISDIEDVLKKCVSLQSREAGFLEEILRLAASDRIANDLMWSEEDGKLFCGVDCSDCFFWGSADAEPLTPETLPILRQALEECEAMDKEHTDWYCYIFVGDLFAARIRKMRPQGASYEIYPPGLWPLFDACGPERETGLGNPHPRPSGPNDPKAKWKSRRDTYEQMQARAEKAEKQLATLQSSEPDKQEWRCYHCAEVFTDQRLAWEHFGDESTCASDVPGCIDPLRMDEKERLKELREAREFAQKCMADMHMQDDRLSVLEQEQASLRQYFGEDCTTVWLAGDRYKSAMNRLGDAEKQLAALQSREPVSELGEPRHKPGCLWNETLPTGVGTWGCDCGLDLLLSQLEDFTLAEPSASGVVEAPPAQTLHHDQHVVSSTYGDLPAGLRDMIQPHEWDNMNFSEQRDWAIKKLSESMVSVPGPRPVCPKCGGKVSDIFYEDGGTIVRCEGTCEVPELVTGIKRQLEFRLESLSDFAQFFPSEPAEGMAERIAEKIAKDIEKFLMRECGDADIRNAIYESSMDVFGLLKAVTARVLRGESAK